jgi:hypothetical protein
MLLIYAHTISPRLNYITQFIFTDLLLTPYILTDSIDQLQQHQGPAICYHYTSVNPSAYHIGATKLLFETEISPPIIEIFTANGQPAFFKTAGDFPFDIFAAAFYLISRYEEYLPHSKDIYGRYAHENSVAFKAGFLQWPLVELWVKQLQTSLQQRFPTLQFGKKTFRFLPTYDIDIAYSYLHKGWWRNLGGALREPGGIVNRLAVLMGKRPDPFDCYAWLDELHRKHHLQPMYFFLVAAQNGQYDKNILPNKPALQQLIHSCLRLDVGIASTTDTRYPVGIHPSWQSGDTPALLQTEKQALEAITAQPITASRQHYIRFNLPDGYAKLLQAGITDDYSMGYGSINGFRASVAQPFYWFNLATNEITALRVHPFCFMDANSFYEQKLSPQQAQEELQHYVTVCKDLNTVLCTIWHNNFLGTDPLYKGWREVYAEFIQSI